jgi:hypothetical protein
MNRYLSAAIVIAAVAAACATVPAPAPRPGPLGQGSARWAYAIAQPSIAASAPDAELYTILGAFVWRDGRLPSNTGDWSFVAWSPSLKQTLQVTVKFDGTFFTTTRNEATPPSQNGQPLPAGWLDSPDIFAVVASHLTCGVTHAQLAVLNVASYPQAPNQPVWGINFNVGQNQLVKWDGTYVGTQGPPDVQCAANLASRFLRADACVNQVVSGTPYDMNDPAWLTNISDQNRNVCAYKFFTAFHMLGYNTEMGGYTSPHVKVLQAFQTQHGFPVSTLVTKPLLLKLDTLLALREAKIAPVAKQFPLYDHMQPLHPNDVSKDWLAYIYQLPMAVLPAYLQMGLYETAQCIWGQCNGFLQDLNGANLPCQQLGCWTTDLNTPYRFVGAYFDPKKPNPRLLSAAVHVDTVLHEYAHYLDGTLGAQHPALPHLRIINTYGFYDISYDMSQYQSTCAPRRSNDPKDWISKYGFDGAAPCPPGKANIIEEFAEAFSIYVAAGKHFRAAAQQKVTIAKKYNWLKTNVFQGIEYDTDLQRDVESGCNDVPGYQQAQPGYTSCSESYVWDAELRLK